MGITKDSKGTYKLTGKTTEQDVLQAAVSTPRNLDPGITGGLRAN